MNPTNPKPEYITAGSLKAAEIKRIRTSFGMTQKELAELLNVSVKSVERWEISEKPIAGAPAALLRLYFSDPRLIERMQIPDRDPSNPMRMYYKFMDEICTVIDIDERKQRIRIKTMPWMFSTGHSGKMNPRHLRITKHSLNRSVSPEPGIR